MRDTVFVRPSSRRWTRLVDGLLEGRLTWSYTAAADVIGLYNQGRTSAEEAKVQSRNTRVSLVSWFGTTQHRSILEEASEGETNTVEGKGDQDTWQPSLES